MTGEKQFGTALYELALEEKIEDAILESLNFVIEAFKQSPEYQKLLSNPAVPKTERLTLIEAAFSGSCERHVISFIKILCERSQLNALSLCMREYKALLYKARDILPVTAHSAIELTTEQKTRLNEKLSAETGKTVELSCTVDKELIAGIRISYDGIQLDGTVKQRLNTLKVALLS